MSYERTAPVTLIPGLGDVPGGSPAALMGLGLLLGGGFMLWWWTR